MAGGGDLDDGGHPAQPVVCDVAHLRGQDAVLGPQQRHPAVQPGKRHRGLRPSEDTRIPLPRPSAVRLADRRGGDVIRDVTENWLVRDRAEACEGRLPRWVDAQLPEDALPPCRLLLWSHVANGGIDDHRPLDARPARRPQPQRDETTHAVPDDYRRSVKPGIRYDSENLVCPRIKVVGLAA